eukprot:m.48966 g.48966  ORF g.48966 m.48966 type:complete len:64 (-) comp10593_c0_seq2:649-840(-)
MGTLSWMKYYTCDYQEKEANAVLHRKKTTKIPLQFAGKSVCDNLLFLIIMYTILSLIHVIISK